MQKKDIIQKIAFLSSYVPRKCGIVSFTADLRESFVSQFPHIESIVVSVNENEMTYNYPHEVRFEISEQDIESYKSSADFLNFSQTDVISLQHEFGLFGGSAGSYILDMLRDSEIPVVTTRHTVLDKPDNEQLKVVQEMSRLSTRFVIMTEKGKRFLKEIYDVDENKIDVIPHGIPDISFIDPNFYKDQFGVEGKYVLLTFGLLSPNKGIENVIESMPKILNRFPNVVYFVLGATHPNHKKNGGETYRRSLEKLVYDLNLRENVIFYNKYVDLEELKEFMGAADIYITPYLNKTQITSGTLAYAFGCGKAVISAPYWHAEELLADGKGLLISLHAIGEGHISSITFRSGIIDRDCEITIDTPKKFVTSSETVLDSSYDKKLFEKKLQELGLYTDFVKKTLQNFDDKFTLDQLKASVSRSMKEFPSIGRENNIIGGKMIQLAKSNYEILFKEEQDISERVIFPATPNEINGIEDARFVEFKEDDGTSTYYSTYTAYDGVVTFPQLIETKDFFWFKFSTLNGPAVHDKDMALFPRKINGYYAMLSRQDGENIYIMFSDMIHFWYTKQILLRPTFDWEFIQIGSCCSPIEIDEGWLVLSHGVGAMRKYAIGAFLLDKNDPTKVLGRTREPILTTNENEREGYVPNVVYTCGAIINNDNLIIPYAMSDYATSFSVVPIVDILAAMF